MTAMQHHYFKVTGLAAAAATTDDDQRDPMKPICDSIQVLYGVVGLARAEPVLLKCNTDNDTVLFRVAIETADMVRRSLSVDCGSNTYYSFTDSPLLVHLV
jgi:hypothetical protein